MLTGPPWMFQVPSFWSGRGHKHPHMYPYPHMCTHAPAPLSAEQSGRDHVTTSLLSISVCSLSNDGHWTLKGVRSAPRARLTVRWRCQLCGQNEPQRAGPQVPHALIWLKHFLWTELDSSAVSFSMEQAQCSPITKSLLLSQSLAPYCLF